LFERLAIDLLRECSRTGAGRLMRIPWDVSAPMVEVWRTLK
jgi:hypothetical protein